MNILIKNCTVLPMTAAPDDTDKYFTGSIGIADGHIAFASADPAQEEAFIKQGDGWNEALRVIDGRGKVAMPGLINLHNHVSMSLMRSYADDMALMPWLTEKIWPFEAKLTRDDIRLGAELGVAEMLLGGTTTFVDMYWETDMVAEAAVGGGIRAVVGASYIDGKVGKAVADTMRVIEKHHRKHGEMLEIRLAPHAAYTNSAETIEAAMEIARKFDLSIEVHLSETDDETRTVRERYGKTSTEYLRDMRLFELPTIAAHCVHLTESDMDIIARYGVSVSHNPQSNMKLASGIAPVKRMLEKGINVGIGTDGPSSNNDLDMWEEMRTASFLQKVAGGSGLAGGACGAGGSGQAGGLGDPCALPAYQTLQMATVSGAKALGKEGRLGIIKKGALADIILVDTMKPHLQPCNDLIANLVYCGKASDVDTVIVNGHLMVESGRLLTLDTADIFTRAQQRVEELKK